MTLPSKDGKDAIWSGMLRKKITNFLIWFKGTINT